MTDNPDGAPHYAPLQDGPPGHNMNDQLRPWKPKVKEMLDLSKLGYTYEATPTPKPMLLKVDAATRIEQQFRLNPFWAD